MGQIIAPYIMKGCARRPLHHLCGILQEMRILKLVTRKHQQTSPEECSIKWYKNVKAMKVRVRCDDEMWRVVCFLFFNILFIFKERGGEGERQGENHQCVLVSHTPPTGDPACNPGMCSHWELNWRPLGLHASTQSTEPHQPGWNVRCGSDFGPFVIKAALEQLVKPEGALKIRWLRCVIWISWPWIWLCRGGVLVYSNYTPKYSAVRCRGVMLATYFQMVSETKAR